MVTVALTSMSPQVYASGLFYGYGHISMDYEWYHGARENNVNMPVHEIAFVDSSGSFRAAMETESNRAAARNDAVYEQERKERNYESFGGRPLTYSYERAVAREGDAKRYGLRLGSDEGLNASSITGGTRGKHLLAYGEISMIAPVTGDVLLERDVLALRHDVVVGVHWGSVKHYNRGGDDIESNRDGGYFYIPVSWRLSAFTPWGVGGVVEAGIDPITAGRIMLGGNEKLPHDKVYRGALEYRYSDFSAGLRIERHYGSFTKSTRKSVDNPVYQHELVGAYLAVGM